MKAKLNRKQNRFQTNRRAFILMTVLCMGIGFAYLTSNLTITGNTSVSGNSWNVYFTNVQVTEGSVDATVVPTTSGTNTTSIDYTVTLDKPGDFYEFTVDAVNDGTIDAMIQSINMTSLDTDVAKYLSYTATYLDGTELAQNDVLASKDSTTYKVRVEFMKNISAEDLSEASTNLTLTFGVNYVQSTLKPMKFIELAKNSALSDTGIDFGAKSSPSNGNGLYVMNSTTEDDYPIYYYRGDVNNNNAKFAGFCWKVVRTTETGGTKLLYNGLPKTLYFTKAKLDSSEYHNMNNTGTYPYVYDSNSKEWTSIPSDDVEEMEITFSVAEAGDYFFNYNVVSESSELYARLYKDQQEIGHLFENGTIELYCLTPENELKITYSKYSWEESSGDDSLSFSMQKGVSGLVGCDNTEEAAQLASTSAFNPNHNSPAYNGYMYGKVYQKDSDSTDSSHIYGNTFTYSNGTYTLSDTHAGVDSTHHYTCLSSSTSCESVKYVYYVDKGYSRTMAYYITLTDGKSVEDAIAEMNTNTNNSTIKTAVDNWFSGTFATYFTTNSKDYNDYLEDTVWCNDRSMNTIDTDGNETYTNNGWKPNGGSTSNFLKYGAYGRVWSGTPSLTCSNKNDSFTVTETETGNGALTYPVGLLTADEMNLAGGQLWDASHENTDFYLYTNQNWWSMSPYTFVSIYAQQFHMTNIGYVTGNIGSCGVRPSISLKTEVKIAPGGAGTEEKPYEFIVE